MKLLKCHIENFGKLSNFDYEFDDGLNTIKEENGFGKTTFASFIKAMFYGMEVKRNTKSLIDRKKYKPWQGGSFGGSLEFEVNGKQYRIERFFEKKEADDTFKLYDLSTNLETDEYTSNIGEEIFKLNKEAYERSTFISGQNMETSMNDSINAKLGNILENENDVNTSEQAIKQIDEAIKNYKKTGGRGEINEKISQKTKLEQKLEQSKIDEKTLQNWKDKNEEIKRQIKDKQQEQEKLSNLLTAKMESEARRAKIETFTTLKNNTYKSKMAIQEYEEFFENGLTTDEESNLEDIINKKISECNEAKDIENKVELNEQKIINLSKEEEKLSKTLNKNKTKNKILCVFSIIMIIVTIILFIRNEFSLIVLLTGAIAILGLIATCVSCILYNGTNKKYIEKKKEVEEILSQQQGLEKILMDLKEDITKFIKRYSKKITDADNIIQLTEIKSNFAKFKSKTEEYEAKLKDQENYKTANNIEELVKKEAENKDGLQQFSKKELEEKISNISTEINELNDVKNYNKNQIELLESNLDTVFDIENELEELNQEIEEMKQKCIILEKTKKYLETAKEQFSSRYLGGMKQNFIKNLEMINGKELDINLDVNLNVQINEKGSNKDLNYFSTGYQDLIYICMRLSLIQALFKEEKPFIILDDPFVNLDETKIKNATDLIKNISNKYQIIYFICHESRI